MIGVISAKEVIFVKNAKKAALAVNTSIAGNSGSSSGVFTDDLDEEIIGNSSAMAGLSRATVFQECYSSGQK